MTKDKEIGFDNINVPLGIFIIFGFIITITLLLFTLTWIIPNIEEQKDKLKDQPHKVCFNETVPNINIEDYKILEKHNITSENIQFGCYCKYNQCPYLEEGKLLCVELIKKEVCEWRDAEGRKLE